MEPDYARFHFHLKEASLQPIINLLKRLGLDKSILFTIIGKGLNIIGGVIILYFISKFLTGQEQGFYYTFSSIIALQVFFELGLSYVIIHYASYETAWLHLTDKNTFTGDEKAKSRLASLLHFTVKWYLIIGVLFLILLLPTGFFFFSNNKEDAEGVTWMGPWALLCFAEALVLLITPLFSFLEGCGKVKEIAFYRIFQSLFNYTFMVLAFLAGFKLYALGIAVLLTFLGGVIWLMYKPNFIFFKDLWLSKLNTQVINWRKEILPFQWKIALSWLSGYLIFQFFNPVLFAYQGSVVAGQMGMSLAAFTGISVVAMAWLNTKIPTFSVLIAKKDYENLDKIFFKTAAQSFFVIILVSFGLAGFIYILQYFQIPIGNRFLPVQLLIFLALINIINQVIFSESIYLRAHKEEPFLLNSVVGSILCGLSTYITGRYFGITEMVIAYFLLNLLIGLPWGTYTFVTKRKLWH